MWGVVNEKENEKAAPPPHSPFIRSHDKELLPNANALSKVKRQAAKCTAAATMQPIQGAANLLRRCG